MEEVFKYKTIAQPTTAEFKDRGSKFLAYAYPILSVADVKEKIQLLKKEHPKAVHHCYAYRIGTDGNEFRTNDDGEPAGSAGRPILGQIDSAGLTNVLVVVVRYFGGSLLGIPGLINAYKTATADAISIAVTEEKWIEALYEIAFDYPVMNEVFQLLRQFEATIYKQELQLFCNIQAGIPKKYTHMCLSALHNVRNISIKEIKN